MSTATSIPVSFSVIKSISSQELNLSFFVLNNLPYSVFREVSSFTLGLGPEPDIDPRKIPVGTLWENDFLVFLFFLFFKFFC